MYNYGRGLGVLLEGILRAGQTLNPNTLYTFTLTSSGLFQFTGDITILNSLRSSMKPFAEIISVERPLFSSRYIVVLYPIKAYTLEQFSIFLFSAFKALGIDVSLFQVEEGDLSTAPGGLKSVTIAASETISSSIGTIVKPLILPLILLGGIAFIVYRGKK